MTSDAERLLNQLGARHRPAKVSLASESLEFVNLSYSLSGEDLILRKRFKEKLQSGEPGTYVDIGAFHPFLASNTYLFYSAGWSGVCVDANPIFKDTFVQLRPRDEFVHAAIIEQPKEVYFAEHPHNTGMSAVFEDLADVSAAFNEPVKIQARRLDDVLDAHLKPGDSIDFMSVDTERSELGVLPSNNWDKHRPAVLCVEVHDANLSNVSQTPVTQFLKSVGFEPYAFESPNIFFEDCSYQPIP